MTAAAARNNAILATTFAHRDTRELSPWTILGISAAAAAENAMAPAMDHQNRTKSSGLVIAVRRRCFLDLGRGKPDDGLQGPQRRRQVRRSMTEPAPLGGARPRTVMGGIERGR